ncbi:hypothetical protein M422DRAFT_780334 [Sphaerobolus stellatus SS14]|uniref:Reverse transcriptase domain-containing protein n=1 Tax=Sphaerobolus stellatus (strain SS14) TaxID=990650 RepID=A0A0C9VSN1_SPHS4|nr:hypothetical protein M422DRAFT_780334 [Sphaerobolus stellatus SS14]
MSEDDCKGCWRPVLNWLAMLYSSMKFVGDPVSPILYPLFACDFKPPSYPNDILLYDEVVYHLEHADDMIIMATSYQGLQHLLDCLTSCTPSSELPSRLPLTMLTRLRLPRPVTLPPTDLSPAYVCTVREALQLSMLDFLVGVETNRKMELLRARCERDIDGEELHHTLAFRVYLLIKHPAHKQALTRLYFSCHSLAIERLRWSDR